MNPTQFKSIQTERPRVNRYVRDLPPSGIRAFFDLVAEMPEVISLGVGEPDFVTPWHICEAGIHSLETGETGYTSNSGMSVLREEVSAYFKQNFMAEYHPAAEILITVGGSEALDLAFRALLEPGDEALVVDPSFVSYAPLVSLTGGLPVRVATFMEQEFKPRIEDLERAVTPRTRALVLNYPNNPTGMTLSHEEAYEIAEFVRRHELFLISDELYVPLSYEGDHPSFCQFHKLKDQLILVHGFSKAWAMTGWRLGMVLGPEDIVGAMTKIHQYSLMCASTTAQHAALEAIRHGDEQVQEMRKDYDARRRFFVHHLNRIGLSCSVPQGAFYAFPSIRKSGLHSHEFATRLLQEEHVAVVPGTAFGKCGEGHIRCSYASSLEDLREAINRMERFLSKF